MRKQKREGNFMTKERYVYRKTEKPVDKDLFAELLVAAKGNRTMKAFAEACGVQPSTFTRIAKKQNKGASSMLMLQAIAENASEDCDVTIAKLAEANGYELVIDPVLGPRFNYSYEEKAISIRRIIPKGTSLDDFRQEDIGIMLSHINSYKRAKLNNRSPYQMFSLLYGDELLRLLNIREIEPNDIVLSPKLLRR